MNSSSSEIEDEIVSLSADEIRARLKEKLKAPSLAEPFEIEPDKPLSELQAELVRQRAEETGRIKQHDAQQTRAPRHGAIWRDDEYNLVLTAINNKMNIARISELIGRSIISIRAKLMSEMTDDENDQLLESIALIFRNR